MILSMSTNYTVIITDALLFLWIFDDLLFQLDTLAWNFWIVCTFLLLLDFVSSFGIGSFWVKCHSGAICEHIHLLVYKCYLSTGTSIMLRFRGKRVLILIGNNGLLCLFKLVWNGFPCWFKFANFDLVLKLVQHKWSANSLSDFMIP